MYFKLNNPMAKNILLEIDKNLGEIEVKGESVRYLFSVRLAFKQLIEGLEEVREETESIKDEKKKENKDKNSKEG